MTQKLKFTNLNKSAFFATLRFRVEAYFVENNISRHANKAMWTKIIFFLSGFLTFYLLLLSNQFGVWAMAGLAALLGAFSAFIGFNICHDAIHGSLSKNKRVNKVFSLLFNFIGANPYVWSISHNVVHHSYTNIPGHDEDIEIAPGLVRISVEEDVNKLQRFQHYYAFLLYGLASLSWVLRKDFLKFFQKKIGQHPNTKHPRKEYFNLFFFKAVYYFLFIVLPLLVLDITWWQFVIGFLWMHFVEGLVMGLVFQLAHVVEGTSFPQPNADGNLEEAWAEHQLLTTANFSPKSKLAAFLCGGLNRQIEHHLFPKICHIHYPAISVIVKEVAEDFNLTYLESPSFFSALKSHYRLLKKLGKDAYNLEKSGPAQHIPNTAVPSV
ncbi:fatty acid desaturase family protein [Pontibacter sp. 13R65]|uniref:fatty acid desaturase family protein n=1 Tax=Pontibacter sp. 13R65 TaxID=3127458 RepID=UPI00301E5DBA